MGEPTLGDTARALVTEPSLAGGWISHASREIVRLEHRRLHLDASLTEDLEQEVALRVVARLRSSKPLPSDAPLLAWTRVVAAYTASEWRRQSRRRPEVPWDSASASGVPLELRPAAASGPCDHVADEQPDTARASCADAAWARKLLASGMLGADERSCRIVSLRAGGASFAQIAEQIGVSRNAVRLCIRRLFRESRDLPPSDRS